MAKRSKVLGSKAIGKALRKYPLGAAAALLTLGGVATALGRSGQIQKLRNKARRGAASMGERLAHLDESTDSMREAAPAPH
jgi:hypothetical protein